MNFDYQKFLEFLIQDNGYILQAFIVIFLALLVNYIQKKVLKRIHAKVKETKNTWDDAFVDALPRPLTLIIWATGIALAADIIQEAKKVTIFQAVEPARDTVIIAALAWFLVRFISRAEKKVLDRDKELDVTTVDAIAKLLRASVVLTATLVALQTLGFSISGVLAFGGIGGIAIGFAAKDLLANFFGGLMIYLDRPFAVGDWVRSPDREIEGTVENIGWRLTRIRTFDKRPLYVPNSIFANIALENPQRMLNRRIYETIGIRYQDASKMPEIISKVKDMLLNHPEIDTQQTLMVNFTKFAPSSLDFFIYTFTKTTRWAHFHEVKQDVLLQIIKIIEDEGAEIAFPTSSIHLAENEVLKNIGVKS